MILTLLVVFILLEIIDIFFTIYFYKNGFTEINPILRWVISKLGLYVGLAIMKVPVIMGAGYFVLVENAGLTFILLLVIPFALLAIYNLVQVMRFRNG